MVGSMRNLRYGQTDRGTDGAGFIGPAGRQGGSKKGKNVEKKRKLYSNFSSQNTFKLDSCMSDNFPPYMPNPTCATPNMYHAVQCYTVHELHSTIHINWSLKNGKIFQVRFKFNTSSIQVHYKFNTSSSSIHVEFKFMFNSSSKPNCLVYTKPYSLSLESWL